jgi:3-phenylpropionate/cinnamic acid dioxygenase small subunit
MRAADRGALRKLVMTDLTAEVSEFLFREAELLDDGQVREWFEQLLHPEITYEMPVRVTTDRHGETGDRGRGWLMKEDWNSLHTRVRRLDTEYAWAEDPPTRTRRFVTNIRVAPGDDGTTAVRSNILVYWSRGPSDEYKLLSGTRRDVLTTVEGSWRLLRRLVTLDHTVLVTQNLSIFM